MAKEYKVNLVSNDDFIEAVNIFGLIQACLDYEYELNHNEFQDKKLQAELINLLDSYTSVQEKLGIDV